MRKAGIAASFLFMLDAPAQSLDACLPYESQKVSHEIYCQDFNPRDGNKIESLINMNLEIVKSLERDMPLRDSGGATIGEVRARLERIDKHARNPVSEEALDDAIFVLENTQKGGEVKSCIQKRFPGASLRDLVTNETPEELKGMIGGSASGFWDAQSKKVIVSNYVSGPALVAVLHHEFLHACDIPHNELEKDYQKLQKERDTLVKEGKEIFRSSGNTPAGKERLKEMEARAREIDSEIERINKKIDVEIFSSELHAYQGTFEMLKELSQIHPEHVCNSKYKNGFAGKGKTLPIGKFYTVYSELTRSGQFVAELAQLYGHLNSTSLFLTDELGNKSLSPNGELMLTPELKNKLKEKGLLN